MTREQLRDAMRVAGELERLDPNNLHWQQAFEQYMIENPGDPVSLNCGGCFNKVKKWLIR